MRTERFEVWDHFRQLAQPGPLKHAAIPQRRRPRVARDVKVREARPGHARQPPRPSEGRSGESEDSEAGPAAGGEEVVHARLRSSRYTRDTFEIHVRCSLRRRERVVEVTEAIIHSPTFLLEARSAGVQSCGRPSSGSAPGGPHGRVHPTA